MGTLGDWRDGFIFVGNALVLDFLNTRPVIEGHPVELLPDAGALGRWLVAATLVPPGEGISPSSGWHEGFDEDLDRLRGFREACRDVVLEMEAGQRPDDAFVSVVNGLLAEHPFRETLAKSEDGLRRVRVFAPQRPVDVFAPLLDGMAQLLTTFDRYRIRKCVACALHFYDTSKKGTRRWCSMQICGNKYKVAAYTRRVRQRCARQMETPPGGSGPAV